MGVIKIGEAEEAMFSKIKEFKEDYENRINDIIYGLELAEKQVPNIENNEIDKVIRNIGRVKETISVIQILIDKMLISDERDEKNFWISWWSYIGERKQYMECGYGEKYLSGPVRQKEFVYAILSWERQICEMVVLLKELQGKSYSKFCEQLERRLHNLIGFYIES